MAPQCGDHTMVVQQCSGCGEATVTTGVTAAQLSPHISILAGLPELELELKLPGN